MARGREQGAVIGDKGVLVVPNYKNKIDEVNFKDYDYNFKNGNLIDPVTGKNFNTFATVHTHPNGSGPSTYVGSGHGDLGFASGFTPYKPAFVFQNNARRDISFVIAEPGTRKGGSWTSYNVTENYPLFNINSIRRNQSLRNYALSIKYPQP